MSLEQLSRVMHVDDDKDVREITKLILESFGSYTVCSCESGEEALEKLSGFSPELVLLDVEMPGMSGPDVLRELLLGTGVPVVFVTGTNQQGAVDALKALGAIDVIRKPLDPLALAGVIAEIWRRHAHFK